MTDYYEDKEHKLKKNKTSTEQITSSIFTGWDGSTALGVQILISFSMPLLASMVADG